MNDCSTTAWAIFLGANTTERLANEWGISRNQAAGRIRMAIRAGYVRRAGRGRFAAEVRP